MQTLSETLFILSPLEQSAELFTVDLTHVISTITSSVLNFFYAGTTEVVTTSVTIPVAAIGPTSSVPLVKGVSAKLFSLNQLLLALGRDIVTSPEHIWANLHPQFIYRLFYALPPQIRPMLCLSPVPSDYPIYSSAQGLGVNHFPVCSLPEFSQGLFYTMQFSRDQQAQIVADYPCFLENALQMQSILYPGY